MFQLTLCLTPLRSIRSPFLLVLTTLLLARQLPAQSSLPVRSDDRTYEAIERLTAFGVIRSSYGIRPITERRLLELLSEARANAGSTTETVPAGRAAAIQRELELLASAVRPSSVNDWFVSALDRLDAEYLGASSNSRPIPFNGLSLIDAGVDPLTAYRHGRQQLGFHTAYLTTTHAAGTERASILFEPRFGIGFDRKFSDSHDQAAVQRLLLSARVGNAAISIGRDYFEWGQGVQAKLFASANATAFDMARVSVDRPVRLPWILRHLGDVDATLLIGRLGEDYFYPNAYLLAYKASIRPTSRLEVGGSYFNIAGGRGSPAVPLGKRIAESIALVDLFWNGNDFGFSNKLAGLEIRWTVTNGGAQLYAELDADDLDWRRLQSALWKHDGGAMAGLFVPLVPIAAGDLHLEFHHTGARFYQHGEWVSGATLHRRILGDALGPDALGTYAYYRRHVRNTQLHTTLAWEEWSSDIYDETGDGISAPRIDRIERRPRERRSRAYTEVAFPLRSSSLELRVGAGIEFARNYGFEQGVDRVNSLAAVRLIGRP